MTITTRVCAFALIAAAGLIAWHWSAAPTDVTHLAVRQFQNDDAVVANLRDATAAQNWWPFIWPVLVVVIGIVMFWHDVERWWMEKVD